jgi:hypothetical protein
MRRVLEGKSQTEMAASRLSRTPPFLCAKQDTRRPAHSPSPFTALVSARDDFQRDATAVAALAGVRSRAPRNPCWRDSVTESPASPSERPPSRRRSPRHWRKTPAKRSFPAQPGNMGQRSVRHARPGGDDPKWYACPGSADGRGRSSSSRPCMSVALRPLTVNAYLPAGR